MILLLHCIVFLVLVGGAATHDSYNYIVRRKAAVASGNGFETSKDSFHRTPGVQSCSRLDAICSSDSKNCSFCSCGKDKTFFSYKHGCLDKDDVHKATNGKCCVFVSELLFPKCIQDRQSVSTVESSPHKAQLHLVPFARYVFNASTTNTNSTGLLPERAAQKCIEYVEASNLTRIGVLRTMRNN